MPLLPTSGTPLADTPEPDPAFITYLRGRAAAVLPQMTHCRRCRADAVGLLGQDMSPQLDAILNSEPDLENRPYVAVASREGLLVNLHLGAAPALQIWQKAGSDYRQVEDRPMPEPGNGDQRWETMAPPVVRLPRRSGRRRRPAAQTGPGKGRP